MYNKTRELKRNLNAYSGRKEPTLWKTQLYLETNLETFNCDILRLTKNRTTAILEVTDSWNDIG